MTLVARVQIPCLVCVSPSLLKSPLFAASLDLTGFVLWFAWWLPHTLHSQSIWWSSQCCHFPSKVARACKGILGGLLHAFVARTLVHSLPCSRLSVRDLLEYFLLDSSFRSILLVASADGKVPGVIFGPQGLPLRQSPAWPPSSCLYSCPKSIQLIALSRCIHLLVVQCCCLVASQSSF